MIPLKVLIEFSHENDVQVTLLNTVAKANKHCLSSLFLTNDIPFSFYVTFCSSSCVLRQYNLTVLSFMTVWLMFPFVNSWHFLEILSRYHPRNLCESLQNSWHPVTAQVITTGESLLSLVYEAFNSFRCSSA
jgi:hypothetical protein